MSVICAVRGCARCSANGFFQPLAECPGQAVAFAVAVHQPGPFGPADILFAERDQLSGGSRGCGQQLADQRDAEALGGGLQQQSGVGEVQAGTALANVRAALYLPVAPVHFALAVQGAALFRRQRQQVGMAGGVEAVFEERAKAAFGLGAKVVADGYVDGLAGHLGYLVGGQ